MEAPEKPEAINQLKDSSSALYIHIPFCRRECYYCNFKKFTYEEGSAEKYKEYLCRELQLRSNTSSRIKTIYFGGGSPAVISDKFLEEIVSSIHKNFKMDQVSEITIEINPEECDPAKLSFIRKIGFNRISVGVQSFSDKDLRYLSRTHDALRGREALDAALDTGFGSVNADLIIGLPGQTEESINKNIKILSDSGADHISAYILEGVKSFGKRDFPDPDQQSFLYNHFREKAELSEFDQYEVSNFCKGQKVSKHNMNYWEGESYIGAGLSASGYEGGEDYTNYSDPEDYYVSIDSGQLPVGFRKKHDRLTRSMAIGLRLVKGIRKDKFSFLRPRILELIEEGFLEETDKYYKVVPSKLVVLNEILSYMI